MTTKSKSKEKVLKFKPNGRNEILRIKKGTYVSYNPRPKILGDGEETAICINGLFFIFSGDLRKETLSAYTSDGLQGILKLFWKKKSWKNGWSNGTEKDLANLLKTL